MIEEPMTTGELLEQWREATRAAELADRLAKLAQASVERSDRDAVAAEEIAKIAQRAAKRPVMRPGPLADLKADGTMCR